MSYNVKHIKIRALHDHVIITDMEFGEMKTASGIVVQSDNAKSHGIKPRWGKVYCIGPDQKDVNVGQWILVEHGRWTRGITIDDGSGTKVVQRVDVNAILAVTDEEPNDFYIGNEIKNGDSITVRPEDFGAR
jgi:co-chaperonin GroES (HSP10)